MLQNECGRLIEPHVLRRWVESHGTRTRLRTRLDGANCDSIVLSQVTVGFASILPSANE